MIDLNKKLQMCMLADFYGNLLTQKQREIFSSYWEKDFSLFEIAEEYGITRQAVHDSLSKAETVLIDTEQKCGFVKKYQENKADLEELMESLNLSEHTQNQIAQKIRTIIEKL